MLLDQHGYPGCKSAKGAGGWRVRRMKAAQEDVRQAKQCRVAVLQCPRSGGHEIVVRLQHDVRSVESVLYFTRNDGGGDAGGAFACACCDGKTIGREAGGRTLETLMRHLPRLMPQAANHRRTSILFRRQTLDLSCFSDISTTSHLHHINW